MRITPNTLTISQLFGASNEQYVIPTYQRRYSWRDRQIWELVDDVLLMEGGDRHLLSSIVCLAGDHSAGINILELVDGQQRLTTVAILLECIRQRFEREGKKDDASEVARLLHAKSPQGEVHPKVLLDSLDASEYERLVRGDATGDFQNADLVNAFKIVRYWVDDNDLSRVKELFYKLQNQAIVIRLDVSDAKDAFKLFETINNRGLRLSPTDIIKNFLLGNAARFNPEALKVAKEGWAALIRHLDGTDLDVFFRYYVTSLVAARVTAGEVVQRFKHVFMNKVEEAAKLPERHLYFDEAEPDDDVDDAGGPVTASKDSFGERVSFATFLGKLVESAKTYGKLVLGRTGDTRIDRHLRNLAMIKATPTFGFLTYLRVGGCEDRKFREVLDLTEALMLRRHTCRERTSDTEALFARVCQIDPVDPVAKTREAYRELCPSDDRFQADFAGLSYAGKNIDRARYCLEKIEMSKHGEHPELRVLDAADVHVEHVIPQKISTKRSREEFGDWKIYLGANAETQHPNFVGRIGNLTLFAGSLNIIASNNPFISKKREYRKSGILLTKDLALYQGFNFRTVEKRSKELAEKAVVLWPVP